MTLKEAKLLIWDRNISKRKFGERKQGAEWNRRTNSEVSELYGQPRIVQFVRQQRIIWLENVQRL